MRNPLLLALLLSLTMHSTSRGASAEQERKCQSSKGAFGSLEGNHLQVPFAYQLELTQGTAVDQVLGTVQSALVDQLLPYTFRECTEDDLITDVIAGVQSNLHNRSVDGVDCRDVTSPKNTCFVIRGYLDVYLAESQAAAIVRQAIALDLHAVLDHHAMDHVTNEVVKVSFLDPTELPVEPVALMTDITLIDYHVLIYMAFTALVLAALTLVCNRRMTVASGNYLPLQESCRY